MQKVSFEWMLDPLASTIVACSKRNKGTELIFTATKDLDRSPFILPEEKERLMRLGKLSPKAFIYQIMLKNIENQPLLEYMEGTNLLLPEKHQSEYRKTIRFSTGNFQIYFVDEAIEKFEDYIFKLVDRNHEDSLKYLNNQIVLKECRNLVLDVRDSDEHQRGRYAFRSGEDSSFWNPDLTLHYRTFSMGDEHKLETDDLFHLIDIFTKINGRFQSIHEENEEIIGKNYGTFKIMGTDKHPELAKKVYQLLK